jgi:hypothetical protein
MLELPCVLSVAMERRETARRRLLREARAAAALDTAALDH